MNDRVGTRKVLGSAGEIQVRASTPKRLAKCTASVIARIVVIPFYVSFLVRRMMFGEQAFRASAQQLSLLPGFVGDYLRAAFYRLTLAGCGHDVQICFGTLFSTQRASIGDHVYVGTQCMLGNVDIGRDALLGSNVHILSGHRQHGIDDVDQPVRLQDRHLERIRIGEDAWIGNGAIVMAHVGRKAVVGAGSVVVSDIPELSIAAGNPARVIRRRT